VLQGETSGRCFQVRLQAGASRWDFKQVPLGETSSRYF
jgi:hypothetical protein